MKIESGKRLYVAVIGARGYVGKAICDSLKNDSVHEVVEVTRTNYKKMKEQKYDIIINSSTPSKRFWAKQNPKKDFEETVRKTADLFYGWTFKKFIQISSVSSRCQLNTVYGRHKAAAENICYSPNNLIIRLGPIFDETLSKGVLIDMLQGNTVFVDGDSRYCFISLRFVAKWICSHLDRVGLVEVGAKTSIALNNIAKHLGKEIYFDGALDHQEIVNPEVSFPSADLVLEFLTEYKEKTRQCLA